MIGSTETKHLVPTSAANTRDAFQIAIGDMTCASCVTRVESAVKAVPGVSDAKVDVVWDPPWTKDRMSDAAKLQLGMW